MMFTSISGTILLFTLILLLATIRHLETSVPTATATSTTSSCPASPTTPCPAVLVPTSARWRSTHPTDAGLAPPAKPSITLKVIYCIVSYPISPAANCRSNTLVHFSATVGWTRGVSWRYIQLTSSSATSRSKFPPLQQWISWLCVCENKWWKPHHHA